MLTLMLKYHKILLFIHLYFPSYFIIYFFPAKHLLGFPHIKIYEILGSYILNIITKNIELLLQ